MYEIASMNANITYALFIFDWICSGNDNILVKFDSQMFNWI